MEKNKITCNTRDGQCREGSRGGRWRLWKEAAGDRWQRSRGGRQAFSKDEGGYSAAALCNLLVFGIRHETPLWRVVNHGERMVFLDESVSQVEGRLLSLEAYDVAYTTMVREMPRLLAAVQRQGECRLVQNLLFSECQFTINDLPNQLYGMAWDIVLVNGPKGHALAAPRRMEMIFTAVVMVRTAGREHADVLVHDYATPFDWLLAEEAAF